MLGIMDDTFSSAAITKFLADLPKKVLDDAPQTYLPTILPLALPTPLHTLNFFTTLHLVHHALASPIHSAYFYESKTTSRDTAIRGAVSLFLASDESWAAENLLSRAAWKAGKLDERAITEHFEITIVREKEHETMKAIRVGERWDRAVAVAKDLVDLFAGLGEKLGGKCVGEAVLALVEESQEVANGDVAVFARAFTEQAAKLVAGIQAPPNDETLPAAPLHLLQDLAYRQSESSDLGISLPPPDELADVSPLPLSLPILLQTDIIPPGTFSSDDQTSVKSANSDLDLYSPDLPGGPVKAISLSSEGLEKLAPLALSASTEIRWATQMHEWKGDHEWKGRLTYHDLWRIASALEERVAKQGKGIVLVGA